MSKLNPLGQSMASLFTPEREKLRAAQKNQEGAGQNVKAVTVPGTQALQKSEKSQDSLGNPASPGYEPLNLQKKSAGAASPQQTQTQKQGYEAPEMHSHFIRLSLGWEKILLTQKKLCEKAKNIFTRLEGPSKYRGLKRASILEAKSRGSILNLDIEELRLQQVEQERLEKEKKEAA